MATSSPPAAIVAFDLDGTLVDSVGDIAAALNQAFGEHGAPPLATAVVRGFVGHGAQKLLERALAAHALPPSLLPTLWERFRWHYARGLVNETVVFPGIAEVLSALRGKALVAVATNKPAAPARALVQALLPGVFDLVLGPEDVGALKPDPAMLLEVERRLAGRIVAFVGDSGVDMETAARAGVPAVGVLWGLRPEEVGGAAHQVRNAEELSAVLSALL